MKADQKGFSVVELLIVIIVVGLVGGAGWYVWQSKNKNIGQPATTTNTKPVEASTNSSTGSLTNGMKLELVSTNSLEIDLRDKNNQSHSYKVKSALYFMNESDIVFNYSRLIGNLDDGGWLIDGEKASELPFVKEAEERDVTPIMGMSLLTPNFFGEQEYFQNKGRIAYFTLNQHGTEDMKNTTESDWEYAVRSSAPAPEGFDYKTKVYDVLRLNPSKILIAVITSD